MNETTEKTPLTTQQQKVFDFVLEFKENNHFWPSLRDIRDAFGWTSINTVECHLRSIEAKGYLYRIPNIARAYVIL